MSEVENQVSQSTESTNAGASVTPDVSPVQATPTPENVGPAGAASHGSEGSAAHAAAVEAYKANLKFQVRGKEQTFEDWIHPFIKDAETEKKVRELHQKAYGIDVVKDERKQFQEMAQNLQLELMPLKKNYERLSGYLEKGDLATFQREANVPDELILKRARDILIARENPALKAAQDQAYDNDRRARELEDQNEYLNAQYEQTTVARRTQELDLTLTRPDVAQAAQAFDNRAGRPGAFRSEVIARGQYYALTQGLDKTPDEIVTELTGLFGVAPQATQPSMPTQAQTMPVDASQQAQPTPVIPVQKPTIPNIQGRGTSPVKKAIKSIDDIKQRHRELAMSNNS